MLRGSSGSCVTAFTEAALKYSEIMQGIHTCQQAVRTIVLDTVAVLALIEKSTNLVDPGITAVTVDPTLLNFLVIFLLVEVTFPHKLAIKLHEVHLPLRVTGMAPMALQIRLVWRKIEYLHEPPLHSEVERA